MRWLIPAVTAVLSGTTLGQATYAEVVLSRPSQSPEFQAYNDTTFNQSGTLAQGDWYLEITYNGPASSSAVTLALAEDPSAQQLVVQLDAQAGHHGQGNLWSYSGAYTDLHHGVSDSGFISDVPACTPPWWSSAVDSFSCQFDHSSATLTYGAGSYGSIDQNGSPCTAGWWCQTFFLYSFHLDNPTTYVIGGFQSSVEVEGSNQDSPTVPDSVNQQTNSMHFNNPTTGKWFDPPAAYGYRFDAESSGAYAAIAAFPSGIDADSAFVVTTPFGSGTVAVDQRVDFVAMYGVGVPWFTITGIEPTLSQSDPLAFPIQLEFTGPLAWIEITPILQVPVVSTCSGDGSGMACPCANSGLAGHGCDNSSGTGGAVLTATGIASLSDDDLQLISSAELPSSLSVFWQGHTLVGPVHYGDGLRCVGGGLKRIGSKSASGGVATYPQGTDARIGAKSSLLGDSISAGETRYYQVSYRDPSQSFCPSPMGSTFNMSSGVAIVWGP